MGWSVLLIDDSSTITEIVRMAFLNTEFELISTKNAEEGLNLAKERQPDMMLVDARMSEIDGYELCSRIKQDPATESIPVLLFIGQKLEADTIRSKAVGAQGFFFKPFDSQDLLDQAAMLCESKPQVKPRPDLMPMAEESEEEVWEEPESEALIHTDEVVAESEQTIEEDIAVSDKFDASEDTVVMQMPVEDQPITEIFAGEKTEIDRIRRMPLDDVIREEEKYDRPLGSESDSEVPIDGIPPVIEHEAPEQVEGESVGTFGLEIEDETDMDIEIEDLTIDEPSIQAEQIKIEPETEEISPFETKTAKPIPPEEVEEVQELSSFADELIEPPEQVLGEKKIDFGLDDSVSDEPIAISSEVAKELLTLVEDEDEVSETAKDDYEPSPEAFEDEPVEIDKMAEEVLPDAVEEESVAARQDFEPEQVIPIETEPMEVKDDMLAVEEEQTPLVEEEIEEEIIELEPDELIEEEEIDSAMFAEETIEEPELLQEDLGEVFADETPAKPSVEEFVEDIEEETLAIEAKEEEEEIEPVEPVAEPDDDFVVVHVESEAEESEAQATPSGDEILAIFQKAIREELAQQSQPFDPEDIRLLIREEVRLAIQENKATSDISPTPTIDASAINETINSSIAEALPETLTAALEAAAEPAPEAVSSDEIAKSVKNSLTNTLDGIKEALARNEEKQFQAGQEIHTWISSAMSEYPTADEISQMLAKDGGNTAGSEQSATDLKQTIREAIREELGETIGNKVEAIAWEVVPELAETIIKKELDRLTADRV